MMDLMQAGHPWQEAARRSGVVTSRSTAYRWFAAYRTQGAAGLVDGRHGHISKVREEVLLDLVQTCSQTPHITSHLLQQSLEKRFGRRISITHLNRLRAARGVSRQRLPEKKTSSGIAYL
jgi:transposase